MQNKKKSQQHSVALSAREVMLHLHREHKDISRLLDVLSEQVTLIIQGEVPDLAIMHDAALYLKEHSDVSHHAKEDIIYRKLAEHGDGQKNEMVSLLIDHEASSKKTEALIGCIEMTQQEPTRDHLKTLKLRCEDYIASMKRHMDYEESQVFPLVLELLSEEDWADIIEDIQPEIDPLFGDVIEQRYNNLLRALSSEVERAAEDVAMAQLIGVGVAMEGIGVLSASGSAILNTLVSHGRQAYNSNLVACRQLWRAKSRNLHDYTSVATDCLLNNYDTCIDALLDIGKILRQSRSQIAEPYNSRLRIYHDAGKSSATDKKHKM